MADKLHPFVHYSTALANIVAALDACERAGFMGTYKQLNPFGGIQGDPPGRL
jgi:hypothetical protein